MVMKKLILGMATIFMMSFQLVMADDVKISQAVKNALEKEFPGAQYVQWEKSGDLYRAIFNYEGQRLSSYFEDNGELFSVTRYVIFSSLPINVIKSVTQQYPGAVIDEAILEVAKSEGTSYLMTIKIKKGTYIIEADPTGNITIVKKQKLG